MTSDNGEATEYLILIERGADGRFGAWSPDLLGCVAMGDTIEEAEREMRSAIEFHLEGMREDGEPPPEPSGSGVYVEHRAA